MPHELAWAEFCVVREPRREKFEFCSCVVAESSAVLVLVKLPRVERRARLLSGPPLACLWPPEDVELTEDEFASAASHFIEELVDRRPEIEAITGRGARGAAVEPALLLVRISRARRACVPVCVRRFPMCSRKRNSQVSEFDAGERDRLLKEEASQLFKALDAQNSGGVSCNELKPAKGHTKAAVNNCMLRYQLPIEQILIIDTEPIKQRVKIMANPKFVNHGPWGPHHTSIH